MKPSPPLRNGSLVLPLPRTPQPALTLTPLRVITSAGLPRTSRAKVPCAAHEAGAARWRELCMASFRTVPHACYKCACSASPCLHTSLQRGDGLARRHAGPAAPGEAQRAYLHCKVSDDHAIARVLAPGFKQLPGHAALQQNGTAWQVSLPLLCTKVEQRCRKRGDTPQLVPGNTGSLFACTCHPDGKPATTTVLKKQRVPGWPHLQH